MSVRALRPLWLLLLVAGLALAAEGKKEAPKDKPLPPKPTEDEIDKPDKAGVHPPTEIPQESAKEEKDTKAAGDAPKGKERNPFAERSSRPKYAFPARITYSDGKTVEGYVWRGGDKPVRIFNRAERAHQDYKLADLRRIDVKIDLQEFTKDWRWKEQGSSEMVYLETGYLADTYLTTFTMVEGKPAAGDCNCQLFVMTPDGRKDSWILYKKQTGRDLAHAKREEIKPLLYVKSVEFTDDFIKKAEEKKE